LNGDGTADLAIANGTAATVSVYLNRPVIALYPTRLVFSPDGVGTASPVQTVTVSNPGSTPLAIAGIAASGPFSQTNNCSATVNVGGSCSISIAFTPLGQGTSNGTLSILDNAAGGQQTIALSGTGLVFTAGPNPPVVQPAPTEPEPGEPLPSGGTASPIGVGPRRPVHPILTPTSSPTPSTPIVAAPMARFSSSSLAFPAQVVGTSSSAQTVMLTNSGDALMPISNITATGDFSQTNDCGTTLEPSAHCTISVTFEPEVSGTKVGTLAVSEDPKGRPQTLSLNGKGVSSTVGSNHPMP
jgi:hypothetical protein